MPREASPALVIPALLGTKGILQNFLIWDHMAASVVKTAQQVSVGSHRPVDQELYCPMALGLTKGVVITFLALHKVL